MNNTIFDFCEEHDITIDQFYGKQKIEGSLFLNSLTTIPENFNPTVGECLDLSSLTTIPENFNPTVGWNLWLSSLTTIPENFNPTVGECLDLSSLTTIPENFNPTVGGYLDLSSLTTIPENFNPTVGGSLYLSSLTTIPENFNPTVRGEIFLSDGLECKYKKLPLDYVFSWQNCKYIKADMVFVEVVNKEDNVYHVKRLNTSKIFYLMKTENGRWSYFKYIFNIKNADNFAVKFAVKNNDFNDLRKKLDLFNRFRNRDIND